MRSLILLAAFLGVVPATGCGHAPSNANSSITLGSDRAIDDSPRPAEGEARPNPLYTRWAGFPVGASVTQRTTTENEDSPLKTVTTIVYTLIEKTDEHVVIEFAATTIHPDGRVETNPPERRTNRKSFTLPPGTKKNEPKHAKPEEGEETLTVAGKPYRTSWVRGKDFTEAGELYSQTWSSSEIPGGLVRSVARVPAKRATITVEVVEVAIPPMPK
jgi:hypothetical protein